MPNPTHLLNIITTISTMLNLDGAPSSGLLPLMDCDHCQYKQWHDGGHCYMFRNKPDGDRCGQFKQKGA